MEWIKSLFSGGEGMLPLVLASIVAFNAILVAVKKMLDVIKDKTSTKIDNVAADWIGKIAGWIQQAIDVVTGNPAHKDPK